MSDEQVSINATGLHLPGAVTTADQLFLDVIPPQWPDGCDIVFMRPGQLEKAGEIRLPLGCMLVYIPPEQANQMRGMIRDALEKQRAAAERQARNGVGR